MAAASRRDQKPEPTVPARRPRLSKEDRRRQVIALVLALLMLLSLFALLGSFLAQGA